MGVHTFEAMGTTVSVRIVDAAIPAAVRVGGALAEASAVFDAYERTFSLYRQDSELSRIARGELQLGDASDELRDMYAAALDWRARTHGAFTPHRPDGVVDLSGIVKAEAIAAAGDVLRSAGITAFTINAGGDIITAGAPGSGSWATGIVDPADRSRLLTTVFSDDALPALADVLATAIVAGGRATLDLVTDAFPVGALVVFRDGALAANGRCRERIVR